MDDINTTHVNIPSGFMGKISDVSWISFLYHYLEHGYTALEIQHDPMGHPVGPDMPVYMHFEQSRGKKSGAVSMKLVHARSLTRAFSLSIYY